jgi:transposase-like protein
VLIDPTWRFGSGSRSSAADLLAVVLVDETAISQQGEEFVLFAAVDPETRDLLYAAVAPSQNTLITRRFLSELAELYGRARQHSL